MKVYADRLPAELSKGLAPAYLITGDEPLLVQEAADAVRAAARKAGHTERERYTAERGFDWSEFRAAGGSLSLFADKRIIEVRLPTGKPGKDGAAALVDYAADPPPDVVLLVVSARADMRSAWVKALDKAGVTVQVWPVDPPALPGWITNRMRALGLRPTPAAARLIAERVEGNLLAAHQEVEKLALLTGGGEVDEDTVLRAVADSARYDVFGLTDAALDGRRSRALRILDGLRAEGVEPPILVWALAREIRGMASLAWDRAAGRPMKLPSGRGKFVERRRRLAQNALGRHDAGSLQALLRRAARVDRVAKGSLRGNVWRELADLVFGLAGSRQDRAA